MSKKSQGETAPPLRFPEFQDAGEWEEGVINDLANGIMGNAFKSIDFIEDGIQLIRMGNLYQGELQLNRTPVYLPKHFNEEYSRFLVKPLDLLMSATGTMGKKDYGFIVQIPESCEQLLLNQRVLKIVHKANCIKGFLLQLLKSESLLTELYSLPGGTKQANLSAQQFKGLKVKFPESKEQQKIADCLSSIDDLITAQAQKIESLKDHKKGLMQQLFPAEGETVPQLRFPEFLNTSDWKPLKLSELSHRINEKVGEKKLTTVSITAGYGFVSQTEKFSRDISGKQYKNYIHLKIGEFSYNKGNSKKFAQGCIYKLKEFEEVAVPGAFISFKFKDAYVADFYQGYFDNNAHGKQLLRYITSGARSDGLLNIKPDVFFSIVLPSPEERYEQQKIADCLSSLDNLITAQTQKVESLKAHKKGLMQQLFPVDN